MEITIIGTTMDLRSNTHIVYAKMLINDYLELVGENFDEFSIQRRRERLKGYSRMKVDIRNGALLPPITLAVKTDLVPVFLPYIIENDFIGLAKEICKPGQFNILDGLQRTYILHDLQKDGVIFKEGQYLLLEFWFEPTLRNLIYRIIVLNAGQKPMSMRHQLEVLFINVKVVIENEIENLEIFQEKDEGRRTRSRKFAMDRIVAAYQCFLYKSPEVQKENIVAQQLVDEGLLEANEDELGDKYDDFIRYLREYAELDDEICRVYVGDKEKNIPSGTSWFGSENVMVSFFAALSDFGTTEQRKERIQNAINSLKEIMRESGPGDDPLGLGLLNQIIQGINARRINVGLATRKLLTSAFKEYFREEGTQPLTELWKSEANY